ncbi:MULTISPECIES: CTP synthetase [Roseinatronobacter]|uniref:CTP synthetase n=1 Tax=Roseinatronobacter domitianus TaxID=2940293 RepID=A0ABT0M1Y6_9RHOB|nr:MULTISPECIES: CTP synthetase [Roseibaca]MCL1628869.1 CTP synthetase [Roseibaca domitiana]
MFRLFPLIFSIAGATCAGIGVVVALVIGQDTLNPILAWAAAGGVVGIVASWVIAKMILANETAKP